MRFILYKLYWSNYKDPKSSMGAMVTSSDSSFKEVWFKLRYFTHIKFLSSEIWFQFKNFIK